jgi:hypothetical protein
MSDQMDTKRRLEQQSDQIEAVLQQHHIPAHVTGGTETPAETRFRVVPRASRDTDKIRDLARALGEALGEELHVARRGAAVDVVVIKSQAETVLVSTVYQQYRHAIPPLTIILGIDASDGVGLMAKLTNIDLVGNVAAPRSLLPAIAKSLALRHRPADLVLPTDLPEIGDLEHARCIPHGEIVGGLARLVKHRGRVGLQRPDVVAVLSAEVPAPILERGPRCGVHVVQSSGGQQITAPWKYGLWINHRYNGTMTAVDRGGGRHTFYPAEVNSEQVPYVWSTQELARAFACKT